MKANEAPEKMYIPKKIYLPYKDGKVIGLVKETGSPYKSGVDGNIEYTRTDAFVQRAAEWLKENADHYVGHYLNDDDTYIDESFIEDFKNFMKGE